jgi:glycosyltransferase involved in cell wall biosynthesis
VWYVQGLIQQQLEAGHEVSHVYPGGLNFLTRRPYVKNISHSIAGRLKLFELVNSPPMPLIGGIRTPADFLKSCDAGIYTHVFDVCQPDIVHVHSLIGLHKEFLLAAKQFGVPVVYTSHDYFGLSPVANFFSAGTSWHCNNSVEFWCSVGGLSMSTAALRMFQLRAYPAVRDFVKRFRSPGVAEVDRVRAEEHKWNDKYVKEMDDLRAYYQETFSLIDRFHFNSTVARDVFLKNLRNEPAGYDIIPVTSGGVTKTVLATRERSLMKRVAYIGPYAEYKGFFEFLKLAEQNTDAGVEFHIWGDDRRVVSSHVVNHGRFGRNDLDVVFSDIDLLVFPSSWMETFGLVAVEALAHGVPVLASQNAGVRDLLPKEWLFSSHDELRNRVNAAPTYVPPFVRDKLQTMVEHAAEITGFYLKATEKP